MKNRLCGHLKDSDMSYISHAKRALLFSLWSLKLTVACTIHALFPFIFEEYFSNHIRKMSKKISDGY